MEEPGKKADSALVNEFRLKLQNILGKDHESLEKLLANFVNNMESKMLTYIGAKIIQGKPMSKHEFAIDRGRAKVGNDESGYVVRYPDGYISWSPEEAFARAYREVSREEAKLIQEIE